MFWKSREERVASRQRRKERKERDQIERAQRNLLVLDAAALRRIVYAHVYDTITLSTGEVHALDPAPTEPMDEQELRFAKDRIHVAAAFAELIDKGLAEVDMLRGPRGLAPLGLQYRSRNPLIASIDRRGNLDIGALSLLVQRLTPEDIKYLDTGLLETAAIPGREGKRDALMVLCLIDTAILTKALDADSRHKFDSRHKMDLLYRIASLSLLSRHAASLPEGTIGTAEEQDAFVANQVYKQEALVTVFHASQYQE